MSDSQSSRGHRFFSLSELRAAFSDGTLTPVDLCEEYLQAIDNNDSLNCYLSVDEKRTLTAASAAAQRYRQNNPRGSLDGIPFAVKDNIEVMGWTQSAGLLSRKVKGEQDAPVVAALADAGAVPLGRVNMDEGAMSAVGSNPGFGDCGNPRMPGYATGGSSSGSGCAVAAGLAAFALGTDTMGSVRIPAALCGVVGLKPSYGRLSTRGIVPVSRAFDHVGPLTRSVTDAFQVVRVLGDHDPQWRYSRSYSDEPIKGRSSLGVLDLGLDENLTGAFFQLMERLQPELEPAGVVAEPIRGSYDARSARREGFILMERELADSGDLEGESLSPTLAGMLEFGRGVQENRLAKAQDRVESAKAVWTQWLNQYDAIALPTLCTKPWRYGEPAPESLADLTAPANFLGVPAVSIPVRTHPESDLLAVQVVGRLGQEAQLETVALAVEAGIARCRGGANG